MVSRLKSKKYLYIESYSQRNLEGLSNFPYHIILRGSGNNRDYEVAYAVVEKTRKGFRAGPFLSMKKYNDISTLLFECKTRAHASRESRLQLRVLALKIAMKDKSIRGIVDCL